MTEWCLPRTSYHVCYIFFRQTGRFNSALWTYCYYSLLIKSVVTRWLIFCIQLKTGFSGILIVHWIWMNNNYTRAHCNLLTDPLMRKPSKIEFCCFVTHIVLLWIISHWTEYWPLVTALMTHLQAITLVVMILLILRRYPKMRHATTWNLHVTYTHWFCMW